MDRVGEIAFVGLGANLGDREATFAEVVRVFEADAELDLLAASSVYETDPIGPPGQGPYLNAVIELCVWIEPVELLARLHSMERAAGRDRARTTERWGARELDLDLLFFGDRVIDLPGLVVPHVRAHERNFVMVPLADIAPDFVHPTLGQTALEWVAALPELGAAYPWRGAPSWP